MCSAASRRTRRTRSPMWISTLNKVFRSASMVKRWTRFPCSTSSMSSAARTASAPVSYTHLDVYKRQSSYTIILLPALIWSSTIPFFTPSIFIICLRSDSHSSDVYKRQVRSCLPVRTDWIRPYAGSQRLKSRLSIILTTATEWPSHMMSIFQCSMRFMTPRKSCMQNWNSCAKLKACLLYTSRSGE